MSLFSIVLFIHVLSSMALFAAFALEAVAFKQIRSSRSAVQVYAGVLTFERLRGIAIPAFLGVLVGGGYVASGYGIGTAWILSSLVATLLMMLVGGVVTGIRMARLKTLLSVAGDATAFESITAQTHNNALVWSYGSRVGLAVGIVFLTTTRPQLPLSIATLAASALTGVMLAVVCFRSGKESHAA
jgi:hypothetical protein